MEAILCLKKRLPEDVKLKNLPILFTVFGILIFLKKLHQQFCLHCHGILCKHIETGEEFYTLFSSSFSAFTSDFVSDLLSCCEEQAVNDSKSAAAKTIAKNFFIFNSFFL